MTQLLVKYARFLNIWHKKLLESFSVAISWTHKPLGLKVKLLLTTKNYVIINVKKDKRMY